MNHHKGIEGELPEHPLKSKIMKEVCKDEWDAIYIDEIGEDNNLLYDLILVANYLDIKPLLNLGCAKVAAKIKGQPYEVIKKILHKNDKGEDCVDEDEEDDEDYDEDV